MMPTINDYPVKTSSTLRYADTDRQGHINSAVFSVFLEVGRSEILYHPQNPLADPGTEFVIAQMVLNFVSEITWPGKVFIGSRVAVLGKSSFHFEQGIFQNDECKATSDTTIVLIDQKIRRSTPLSAGIISRLQKMMP